MTNTYEWTDNPTVSGVSVYDPDVLNDCLMHLKYDVSTEFDNKIATCSKNDFSNITSTAKSTVAKLSAPSAKNISLSAGAAGSTYTAPANGWFYMQGAGIAAFCFLGLIAITESGDELFSSEMVVYQAGNGLATLLPVKKGQVIKINYYNVNISKFRFYYAEGDAPESEA